MGGGVSAEIFKFPASRRQHNTQVKANQVQRKQLADWFRAIAQHIEGNEVEHEPLAAMIVLSSAEGDEVLHVGYQNDQVSLREAGSHCYNFTSLHFTRRGGNFYDRRK